MPRNHTWGLYRSKTLPFLALTLQLTWEEDGELQLRTLKGVTWLCYQTSNNVGISLNIGQLDPSFSHFLHILFLDSKTSFYICENWHSISPHSSIHTNILYQIFLANYFIWNQYSKGNGTIYSTGSIRGRESFSGYGTLFGLKPITPSVTSDKLLNPF